MRRKEVDALRDQASEWRHHAMSGTEALANLTREYTDLLMFAEAFAEEIEGRRGEGQPIEAILAEYRAAYPFE